MEEIKFSLDKKDFIINVQKKNIKRIILRVYPDLTIKVSAPIFVSDNSILEFVNTKTKWIANKLEAFSKTEGYAATNEIKDGGSIRYLGRDLVFKIEKSDINKIELIGNSLYIYTKKPEDNKLLMRLFSVWWAKENNVILKELVDKYYPIVGKYNVAYPEISLRTMKTMWGTCNIKKHKVTFNKFLIKARIPFIEYVVLHELTHFLYPNHSRTFYNFIGNYMPDWKERKKYLDNYVVHGL